LNVLITPAIVAGDFNNHPVWDKPGRLNNHANTVKAMTELSLASAYHAFHNIDAGKEAEPTLYWRNRKKDGPKYHIDYCFIPKAWTGRLRQITVGSFEPWIKFSDHRPLIVDLEF
jgi:exodeoxyribonuclease-3